MKKKTFIVIWMLFIIFINSSMLIVSMVTLREQIFAEREKALAEHYVISSGLIGDMQAVKSRGGDVKASMDELMRTYSRYSQSRDNGFAVSCDGEWIWYSGVEAPKEEMPKKKVCPFCKEEVAIDAVKCPHCISELTEDGPTYEKI